MSINIRAITGNFTDLRITAVPRVLMCGMRLKNNSIRGGMGCIRRVELLACTKCFEFVGKF
jgi:hypothetical protein